MKRFLKEPLLHFLVLSGLIFLAYGAVSRRDAPAGREIVVSRGKIESLAALFARTWQRPPTPQELQGLIDDYVREEVLYREGVALGLDRDDTVVRRRVGQKMEFVSEELTAAVEPTDADLQAYVEAHPAAFVTQPQFSFRQVYLDPQRRGDALDGDSARLLRDLRRAGDGADPDALGDPTMLPSSLEDVSAGEVKATFGAEFAIALASLAPGQWQGPVRSGYGTHLVFVSKRVESRLPPLDVVRATAMREWRRERQEEAAATFYQHLLQRYAVVIESSTPGQSAIETGGAR